MEMILLAGMESLPRLLVGLLIFCLVFGAAYWLITNLLPAQIQKFAIGVLIVVAVLVLVVYVLLPLAGGL